MSFNDDVSTTEVIFCRMRWGDGLKWWAGKNLEGSDRSELAQS